MKLMYVGGPTPEALESIGISNQKSTGGGWASSLISIIKNNSNYEIAYLFYWHNLKEFTIKKHNNVIYYALPLRSTEDHLTISDYKYLQKAYTSFLPDIVHIFGTERKKTLDMLDIAGSDKCIISITGLVSICEKHYLGGIDSRYLFLPSFNDFVRKMSPSQQKRQFKKLGKYEIESIKKSKYVFGRTTWDYACINQFNPNISYFHCGEVLRPIFYDRQWNLENVQRHSLFVSQGSYPLKGLHKLFEALPIIISKYPDVHLYIAGPNIVSKKSFKDIIKRTTYGRYLRKIIRKNNLENNITFLGPISDTEMCERYLSTHVFVCPSLIENSSNALGEAMLLGVPCIASCVGGMQDLIKDRVDGFLYPFDEPYMLAHYICALFENNELACDISNNARKNALKTYDKDTIIRKTLAAYDKIIGYNKKGNDNNAKQSS